MGRQPAFPISGGIHSQAHQAHPATASTSAVLPSSEGNEKTRPGSCRRCADASQGGSCWPLPWKPRFSDFITPDKRAKALAVELINICCSTPQHQASDTMQRHRAGCQAICRKGILPVQNGSGEHGVGDLPLPVDSISSATGPRLFWIYETFLCFRFVAALRLTSRALCSASLHYYCCEFPHACGTSVQSVQAHACRRRFPHGYAGKPFKNARIRCWMQDHPSLVALLHECSALWLHCEADNSGEGRQKERNVFMQTLGDSNAFEHPQAENCMYFPNSTNCPNAILGKCSVAKLKSKKKPWCQGVCWQLRVSCGPQERRTFQTNHL